ncbi:DEAD-domain-containing protein, partial [Neoconidiobolus thromboides FSU 785]
SFSVLGLDKALCNHLKGKMKVNKPTVVQSKTISFFNYNLNKDVIVQAQTGSGKTLAFLLPIVNSLIKASGAINPPDSFKPGRMSGLISVVLAPTRELAKQIYDVLNILLNYPITSDDEVHRYHWIVPGLVVGGEKKSSEKSRLRKGVNILIATPGRFLDHLQNTKSMEVNRLKWIVLDEGDRFLELGLQETLKNIFNVLAERQGRYNANFNSVQRGNWFWNSHHLPKVRQTVLVSATLNSAVQKLAEYSLSDPIHLTGSEEGEKKTSFSTPQQLTQSYMAVPAKLRLVALTSLFKKAVANKMGKLVVFMLTCEQVDFYHQLFCKAELQNEDYDEDIERPDTTKENLSPLLDNLAICKLHGNMDQASRTASFKQFSNLEHGVLLCTDVAARGLDMPKVGQIIQFDPPTDVKDYVHRVGRTARLGKGGDAILFLLPSEMDYINILKSIKIFLKPRSLEDNLKALTDKVTKDYQVAATIYQNSFEKLVLNDSEIQKQARKAYISNIRAYATHPASEKSIFHVKKLHYGHIAKSFGLREAPSSAIHSSKSNDKQEESGKKRVRSYASTTSKRLLDPNSEFASGTFTTKLSKKK